MLRKKDLKLIALASMTSALMFGCMEDKGSDKGKEKSTKEVHEQKKGDKKSDKSSCGSGKCGAGGCGSKTNKESQTSEADFDSNREEIL